MINNCLVCKKEFKTYPSKIKLGKGKYCSKGCCLKITNQFLKKNNSGTRFEEGQPAHNYQGFRFTEAGYKEIFWPIHPNATSAGYVCEHRLVMELYLGRLLEKGEDVHHLDGNKLNNRIDNLMLLTHSEHTRLHNPVRHRWINFKGQVMPYAHHAK